VPARAAIDVSIARDLVTDRIRHGWTQTELARRSGVRLETISRIESGKPLPSRKPCSSSIARCPASDNFVPHGRATDNSQPATVFWNRR
jgi:DNA-binding XRE family transcriptional regulator